VAKQIRDPKTLEGKLIAHPGKTPSYPWKQWLNGGIWEITQGEDFHIQIESMKRQIEAVKKKWGEDGRLKFKLSIFKTVDKEGKETGFILGPSEQLRVLRRTGHSSKRFRQVGRPEGFKVGEKKTPKPKQKKTKQAKKPKKGAA
jgi:hypothetical protein